MNYAQLHGTDRLHTRTPIPLPLSESYSTDWHFTLPPDTSTVQPEDEPNPNLQQLKLLTICGHTVIGQWSGKVGEFFTAWAPIEFPTQIQ